jgi:hypothetical protein
MSDFRDRLGAQLRTASTALAKAGEADFRARLGASLTRAAGELAAARQPLGAPAHREWAPLLGRLGLQFGLPRVPGLARPDFRARLGLALTRSARELAAARRPIGAPARGGWAPRVPRLSRPVAVGLTLSAFAGTAFAAVAIWTPLLGNQQYGYNPGISASAPPADQLAALAVLRRPQSAADQSGALASGALRDINQFTRDVRTDYIRVLAGSGTNGFVLVPVAQRLAVGVNGIPVSSAGAGTASATVSDALCLYATDAGAIVVNCYSAAQVIAGTARNEALDQLFGLAPDGVSAVTVTFTGGLTLSAPVQHNFFDVTLPSGASPPPGPPTVTYSTSN